jgi:hypothetical protein
MNETSKATMRSFAYFDAAVASLPETPLCVYIVRNLLFVTNATKVARKSLLHSVLEQSRDPREEQEASGL